MAKPKFDFASLTELPRSTLDQIVSRARALLAFGTAGDNPVESVNNYDWLISGIMRELQSRGLNGTIPIAAIINMREYKTKFLPCAASMDTWLRKQVTVGTDRASLLALSRLAAECLAERIGGKFHAPVCLSTMLTFYVQVPDAIEENFPSYCQHGWIPMLLKRRR